MKNFIAIVIGMSAIFSRADAQIGINNSVPRSTLDITAKISSGSANPTIKDGIIIPNIDRARAQAMGNNTTPAVPESTLIYVNNVTTGSTAGSAININLPGYYYFDSNALPSPGLWQALRPTNVELYAAQLIIPPHHQYVSDFNNHSNANFDRDNWWVISKTSVSGVDNQPSRMTIVYEFQGTSFNVANLYPQLTAGNNSGFADVYVANIISLANTGTAEKTRLTVSIVRSDHLTNNWGGAFLLNVLLARKIN
ncbi:hypothetical protein [Chryseobacterium herbae]|uniref:Cleaved adhesin domain-containing protein n=1 Tax=Chryseobacterium herbae TaxID=2976476 RepID=A0ABT2ITC1_9FLAO|nr:hypothetical protein [Chryseobacterium sp. pc1-10]MCT2562080.1 hypothetical protein [Chryseobacterium sp. pc1-10]